MYAAASLPSSCNVSIALKNLRKYSPLTTEIPYLEIPFLEYIPFQMALERFLIDRVNKALIRQIYNSL